MCRESCPIYSLHAMPKELLERVRRLPAMPPANEVHAIARTVLAGEAHDVGPMAAGLRNTSTGSTSLRPSGSAPFSVSVPEELRLKLRHDRSGAEQDAALLAVQRDLYAYARGHLTTSAVARDLVDRMFGSAAIDHFRATARTAHRAASRAGAVGSAEQGAQRGRDVARNGSSTEASGRRMRVLFLTAGAHDTQARLAPRASHLGRTSHLSRHILARGVRVVWRSASTCKPPHKPTTCQRRAT